ncbi:matrix protein [Wenling dimarhabdovirus 1]|uniref:Matrix protein n=1 Tax=Wenling dimarhabdovirus 1 TaxID=2116359 RepID=A0A2P1GMT2_9RHAB|nr:matrix protein [Wenling dimarhabdovirus 1]
MGDKLSRNKDLDELKDGALRYNPGVNSSSQKDIYSSNSGIEDNPSEESHHQDLRIIHMLVSQSLRIEGEISLTLEDYKRILVAAYQNYMGPSYLMPYCLGSLCCLLDSCDENISGKTFNKKEDIILSASVLKKTAPTTATLLHEFTIKYPKRTMECRLMTHFEPSNYSGIKVPIELPTKFKSVLAPIFRSNRDILHW